ncbi:MAG: insulinase family protein [Planctomycetes bacterium]|nr:insulinase family protein [Planctomycetota bacterium]
MTLTKPLRSTRLTCGAWLLSEHMPSMSSVSVAWLSPVGTSGDPDGAAGEGESAMCAEMLLRGTERSTSEELARRLDVLGVQRNTAASMHHVNLSAVTTGPKANDMLACLGEMVRSPRMDPDGVEQAKALGLQAIAAIRDEPQQLCTQHLLRISMPAPFNRSGLGTPEGIRALTADGLHAAWHRRCTPGGTLIGLAGDVDHDAACAVLDQALAGWAGSSTTMVPGQSPRSTRHIEVMPTSQTHMALSLDAPSARDEDRHAMRLATRVLGGGSSSRLFDEVRERRGLCYSVGSSYSGGRDLGRVMIYAGSRSERAQETLDCILRELERLERGIDAEELERARTGILSRMVMSEESTSARAMALASDWFTYGRLRSLDELTSDLRGVSLDQVNALLARRCGASWRDGLCRSIVAPTDLA